VSIIRLFIGVVGRPSFSLVRQKAKPVERKDCSQSTTDWCLIENNNDCNKNDEEKLKNYPIIPQREI
jgi:hypothetical protein